MKKIGRQNIAIAFIASLALVGLAQFSLAGNSPGYPPRTSTPDQIKDNYVEVQVLNVGGMATLGGTVIPVQEVTLAAQMPGRIEYIAGVEGDNFKRGDELIRIDDDDLLAQQRSAKAQLDNAHLAARNAGVQYSRELYSPQSRSISGMPGMGMPALFDQMFTQGMGNAMGYGDRELDRYSDLYAQSTQLNQSRSRVTQAKSRLDEIAAKIRDLKSIAPFDGVIARKLIEVGDTVQPGQHMIVFSNLGYLQVKVDVPSRLMHGLKNKEFLSVRLDDQNKTIVQGRVAQKYPVADSVRHTVTVKIDLKKTAPATPGMYAEVMIPAPESRRQERIVIPSSAILSQHRGSLPVVYVWNDLTSRKERRYVRLGGQVDDKRIIVLSGLKAGDKLFVENTR